MYKAHLTKNIFCPLISDIEKVDLRSDFRKKMNDSIVAPSR